ncbi:Fanconi anemia protein FancD2 nuclease-domain-containing protein [Obelidium mucronatum]|nr:Fanconi anemia protein FancD2 nuclease-domain-containing protein [Obelidium mucronatum]
MGISRHKIILDAWLKFIADITRARDFNPMDVIVLTLLRSDLQTQKKVDALFKAKIKSNLISPSLIGNTFKQYFVGMHHYFSTILGSCEGLVREGDAFHSVAISMYCSSFLVFDTHNRQQLIGCIIAHIGSGVQHEVDCGLKILLELTSLSPEDLDQLTISQIRVLYEVFASLGFEREIPHFILKPIETTDESSDAEITFESGLLSDMRIIVRKQLGSDDPKFKQMGVLGAIALIKRLASVDLEVTSQEGSTSGSGGMSSRSASNSRSQGPAISCERSSISDLGLGENHGNDAADGRLISTRPEVWFRIGVKKPADESQDMIPETELSDINLMHRGLPTLGLASTQLKKHEPPLELEVEDDESDRTQLYNEKQLLMLLPACFKFLQCIELHVNGSLDEIGMVLDMGVLMYAADEIETSVSASAKEVFCSAIFYAINYLREILNAFAKRSVLNDNDGLPFSGIKCLKRVGHILELESQLEKLLPDIPRWAPVGFFRDGESNDDLVLWEQDGTDDEEEPATAAALKKSQKLKKGKQKLKIQARFSSLEDIRPIFRELELDVFNLLSCPYLKLPSSEILEAQRKQSCEDEEEAVVQFPELLFLYTELQFKLEFLCVPNRKSNGSVGSSILQRMPIKDVASRIIDTVPALCIGLEAVISVLRREQEEYEKEDFVPRPKSWSYLKNNDALSLRLLKIVASRANPELAANNSTTPPNESPRTQQDQARLISKLLVDCHDYFFAFKEFAPTLPSAVMLIKLLVNIHRFSAVISDETLRAMKEQNECITYLLEAQIVNANKPYEVISDYIHRAFKALLMKDGNICSKYPLLNMHTFPVFFKIDTYLFQRRYSWNLSGRLTMEKPQQSITPEYIARITKIASTFSAAVELSKQSADPKHFGKKTSRRNNPFVFVPALNRALKKFRGEVVGALRAIQAGTRVLQTLANDCKAKRDTILLTHIPPLRKSLEALIFEVKKMMVDHELGDAFYLANLKHKNLRGEAVSSQIEDSDVEEEGEAETEGAENAEEAESLEPEEEDEGEDQIEEEEAPKSKKRRRSVEVEEEAEEEEEESNSSKNEDEIERSEEEEEEEASEMGNKSHENQDDQPSVALDEEEEDDEEEDNEDDIDKEMTPKSSKSRQQIIRSSESASESHPSDDESVRVQPPQSSIPKSSLFLPSQSINLNRSTSGGFPLGKAGLSKLMTGARQTGLRKGGGLTLTQSSTQVKHSESTGSKRKKLGPAMDSIAEDSIRSNEYVDDEDMTMDY